ncbi:hypothetical protein AVEN_208104-1 [Araneus ventricosus]|uniref:Uncharacterized protein n=1 Tax=Araneus ventricosus TaxID=182803 RepID=A0A4Y2FZH5_ARAVE|nr:hypothetical protein AVEN_208104-1 [Araneus ventricosus]
MGRWARKRHIYCKILSKKEKGFVCLSGQLRKNEQQQCVTFAAISISIRHLPSCNRVKDSIRLLHRINKRLPSDRSPQTMDNLSRLRGSLSGVAGPLDFR